MMDKNFTITAHCLVKNEENFIWYAIKSVIDFVDQIIIFDTGSTDKTIDKIKELQRGYPDKIIFEEKGECDKKRHTELRQEMLDRTTTDWFMILDGDEVWTERGIEEVIKTIHENPKTECLIAPFYLCVGDIFHYSEKGKFKIGEIEAHATPRFFKKVEKVKWLGEYDRDVIIDSGGAKIFEKDNSYFLSNKFWHLTHLERSSVDDNEYSSGGSRMDKRRLTYFIIGRKIKESVPEVFGIDLKKIELNYFRSFINFTSLVLKKIFKI